MSFLDWFMSLHMPRSAAYIQWNSSVTLYISKIFFPYTPHLKPRLEVSASIVFFRLDPSILFLLIFRFLVSKKCLKLLFPCLAIVQRKSTTIPPVIIVLIIVVIVMRGVLRTRGIPLVSLGFLWKSSLGSQAGVSSSVPPSSPLDEEETVYSCAVGIHSKTSEQRLSNLRTWYQIPDEFNPRLPVRGEWCCNPRFGIGVYKVYFL